MKINGNRLEFRLFDADAEDVKERYFQELDKMKTIKEDTRKVRNMRRPCICARGRKYV